MSITIKPNSYYKDYFSDIKESNIIYTDAKMVYLIALVRINKPTIKLNKKLEWGTIKHYQRIIKDKPLLKNVNNYKIEEISKEDVFLELL